MIPWTSSLQPSHCAAYDVLDTRLRFKDRETLRESVNI